MKNKDHANQPAGWQGHEDVKFAMVVSVLERSRKHPKNVYPHETGIND